MKKFILSMAAVLAISSASALPKAFYVKKGDEITKYNFGVADNLKFSDNGRTLTVLGYGEAINLDEIDYISFSAPLGTALTPAAQKEKLVAIGSEAIDMVDLQANADILNAWHAFFDGYEDENYNWIPSPSEYGFGSEEEEAYSHTKTLAKAFMLVAKGNPAAMRAAKAEIVNIYKLSDIYGIYTANDKTYHWDKTEADHIEFRFNGRKGEDFILKLTHSSESATWETNENSVEVPKNIDITFSKGSTKLCSAKLNTSIVSGKSIDMTLDFEANGYVANNVLKVVDNLITDNVTVKINGKELVNATSTVQGRNFVNYDVVYDAVKAANGYYAVEDDWDSWVDEDATDLMALFTRAEANVDILGKMQVKGLASNPSKIYEKLSADSYSYEYLTKDGLEFYTYGKLLDKVGNVWYATDQDRSVVEAYAESLNSYIDAGFFYDGTAKQQGYLGWDVVEDEWDRYTDWHDGESIRTNGFIIVDGFVVNVYRNVDWVFNETTNEHEQVVGPWGYRALPVDNRPEVFVEVKEADVQFPSAIMIRGYEVAPILMFPDQTSFSMEDFFDEGSFSKLIDDYNDIVDTYLSITGQERDNNDNY